MPLIEEIKRDWDSTVPNMIKTLSQDIKAIFSKRGTIESLTSVVREWCDPLSERTKQYLFSGNENRILNLMLSVTNDETAFVQRLAKAVTSLRIEDWNSNTITAFLHDLRKFKDTVETYNNKSHRADTAETDEYKIAFKDDSGKEVVKTFGRVEYGGRAKTLFNAIQTDLEEHGQAITEQEKRQVLMELLQKLC